MAGRVRMGTVAFGIGVTGALVAVGPGWTTGGPKAGAESQAAYMERTCSRVIRNPPLGGLDKTTVPAAGSAVTPGQQVLVTLRWDTGEWDGPYLHKTIDCVTVNGNRRPDSSVEEKPTLNDGVFETTVTIPDGLVEGDEVCDQGFLSGDASGGGFEQASSPPVCFTVQKVAVEEAPALTPSSPVPAPVPPVTQPVAVAPPGPTPAVVPAPAPVAEVLGMSETAPVELPRTGAGRDLPALGGLGLALGGLGWIGGTRRPRSAKRLR